MLQNLDHLDYFPLRVCKQMTFVRASPPAPPASTMPENHQPSTAKGWRLIPKKRDATLNSERVETVSREERCSIPKGRRVTEKRDVAKGNCEDGHNQHRDVIFVCSISSLFNQHAAARSIPKELAVGTRHKMYKENKG